MYGERAPRSKQLAVLTALVEGAAIRSTERMVGMHRDTAIRLMVRVGTGCSALLDEMMVDLPCSRLELDELWSFIAKRKRHVESSDDPSFGDTWSDG